MTTPVDLSLKTYDPALGCSYFAEMKDSQMVRQETPTVRLFEAIANGDLDFARQALLDGADPNARDADFGATPLHHAALSAKAFPDQHVAICRLLKDFGAELDAWDSTLGWTALEIAREKGAKRLERALTHRLIEAFID